MDDTLGIYNNNTVYDENTFDVNKHIEQGIEFMNYGKMYGKAKDNNFSLLTDTSSPNIGSIIEAYRDGPDSTGAEAFAPKNSGGNSGQTAQEAQFNALLSAYTTSYNTFNASLLKRTFKKSDLAQRKAMEKDLNTKYQQLASLARSIQGNFQHLKSVTSDTTNSSRKANQQLLAKMNELKQQQRKMKHLQHMYDVDSIDGGVETTLLAHNSFHMHYMVYLIVIITVLAFILNLFINPNANVMNATYVVGALFAVYVISRWMI